MLYAVILAFCLFPGVPLVRWIRRTSATGYVHLTHALGWPLAANIVALTCLEQWAIRLARVDPINFEYHSYDGPHLPQLFGVRYWMFYVPVAVPITASLATLALLALVFKARRSEDPPFKYKRRSTVFAVLRIMGAGFAGLMLSVLLVELVHVLLIPTLLILFIGTAVVAYFRTESAREDPSKDKGKKREVNSHYTMSGDVKVGYGTKNDATEEADRLSASDGSKMGVYRCTTCQYWHVGHSI